MGVPQEIADVVALDAEILQGAVVVLFDGGDDAQAFLE